jgi:hypothetical protein
MQVSLLFMKFQRSSGFGEPAQIEQDRHSRGWPIERTRPIALRDTISVKKRNLQDVAVDLLLIALGALQFFLFCRAPLADSQGNGTWHDH